jgi:hypothetical protein
MAVDNRLLLLFLWDLNFFFDTCVLFKHSYNRILNVL